MLAERWEGKRLNAPNDIVVSRNDHVYFTDPAFGSKPDHRELDFYGVYHLPPKGPLKLVAKPTGRPNGIALSRQRPHALRGRFRRAQRARLRPGPQRRRLQRARGDLATLTGVPGGIAWTRRAISTWRRKGIAIYGREASCCTRIEMHEHAFQLRVWRGAICEIAVHHGARHSSTERSSDVKGALQ